MAFGGSAGGAPGQAIMWLYVVTVCGLFVLVGRSWWSLVWGFPIGVVMAIIQLVVGGFQAKSGMREYAAAVRAACDSVFASVREESTKWRLRSFPCLRPPISTTPPTGAR